MFLFRRQQAVITITVWLLAKALNIHLVDSLHRSDPGEYGQRILNGSSVLDLRKAFDTVEHLLHIKKLKSPGVVAKSLAWFRSYLSALVEFNEQCVIMHCRPAKITMGVLQGSILGPLLFLVYINGIHSVLNHSKMTMFADGMVFFCHENLPTDMQST